MLKSVEEKIDYSLNLSKRLMGKINDSGALWYHSIGMLNAFYAICEELKHVKGNNLDPILSPIVKEWLNRNEDEMHKLFLGARNRATHRGAAKVEEGVDWILNHYHNTEFPENYAVITIPNTDFKNMRSDEFLEKCTEVFSFLRNGLVAIQEQYLAQGGTKDLFHKPKSISDLWGEEVSK